MADDDLMWDGLPCPPLEEYAFNFETNFLLDDLLMFQFQENEEEIKQDQQRPGKSTTDTRRFGKGKDIRTLGLVLQSEMHSKTIEGFHPKHQPAFIGGEEKNDKKRKFMNNGTTDYELRFEASSKKLREEYKQCRDAKRQKQIQVIGVQKLVKEQQPRSNCKSKGKPSLRQKLMASGTRKSNKKFPPLMKLCL